MFLKTLERGKRHSSLVTNNSFSSNGTISSVGSAVGDSSSAVGVTSVIGGEKTGVTLTGVGASSAEVCGICLCVMAVEALDVAVLPCGQTYHVEVPF